MSKVENSFVYRMCCGSFAVAVVWCLVLVGGVIGLAAMFAANDVGGSRAWAGTRENETAAGVDDPPGSSGPLLRVIGGEWHDADTRTGCDVELPYGVQLVNVRIRAASFDAWELGTRGGVDVNETERARGRRARDELAKLSVGKTVFVRPIGRGGRDGFGRLLGDFVLVDGEGRRIDVAAWARANGHTRPAE